MYPLKCWEIFRQQKESTTFICRGCQTGVSPTLFLQTIRLGETFIFPEEKIKKNIAINYRCSTKTFKGQTHTLMYTGSFQIPGLAMLKFKLVGQYVGKVPL